MNGRKLTIEQKNDIQGKFFNESTFFNCVQDINDEWYVLLSKDDMQNIGDYAYLLDLPLSEYVPKPVINPF